VSLQFIVVSLGTAVLRSRNMQHCKQEKIFANKVFDGVKQYF
jgi:anthranilate/para-aminobenzoate synthase component II